MRVVDNTSVRHVRAALKKRGLTVSEWKSQKESKAQGQMNVNK